MRTFKLSIRTPEAVVFEGDVESLVVPGLRGLFGVLGGHAPMVAGVSAGVLAVQAAGQPSYFVVGDGTFDVRHNQASLLVDTAEGAASRAEAGDKDLERRQHHPDVRA